MCPRRQAIREVRSAASRLSDACLPERLKGDAARPPGGADFPTLHREPDLRPSPR